MSRMIHRNKCEGGYAVEEKDGVYCMGRVDEYIDSREPIDECKKCPRHLDKYLQGDTNNHRSR